MLGITDFWAFVAAVLVFLALPGPGTFTLLTATGKGGFRAGAAATFGLMLGDQVLMWLAALGVAAVLQGHQVLFKALQYAGAGYIVFIGLRLAFCRGGDAQPIRIHPGRYFRQALWITLLNPKAIVFYMAFFPLFIDPQTQMGAITFAAMAVTIAALSVAYFLTLVACAHAVTALVKAHRGMTQVLERVAGAVLIGLGLKLAL
jgi:threonine/homoserine/homoserine lactone efflux protein